MKKGRALTNLMGLSLACEAESPSITQEFLLNLWNPKFHWNSPKTDRIASLFNHVYAFMLHAFRMHFNIILPPRPPSFKRYVTFKFSFENFVCL